MPPRCDLEAVADHVVLERLDAERLLAVQRLDAALRHGERVVGEVDLLLVLVPLEEREVDDPAQLEAVAVDEVQFLAGAGARGAREGRRTSSGRRRRRRRRRPRARPSCWRMASVRSSPMFLAIGPAPSSFVALPCARRCSRGPAGPRLAPRNSCGRRRRADRRSWPEWPRPRPSDRWPGCRRTP